MICAHQKTMDTKQNTRDCDRLVYFFPQKFDKLRKFVIFEGENIELAECLVKYEKSHRKCDDFPFGGR